MADGIVLEQGTRLSESLLWRLQRRFYDQKGPQAWAESTVPHYITSNVWIANAYAKVVFGWLRDCAGAASREAGSFPPLDLRHPVHIVELGCGSGRFGYLFLNRLLDLLGRSALSHVPVRYVFTDFTESNLDHLRNHPSLQPFLDEGLVDFARYDAVEDAEIRLGHSGEVLSTQTLRNPLAVIANYVFDSIPQDAFRVRDGKLFELLATLTVPEEEKDLDDPALIQKVQVSWEEHPAAEDYYGDPELDPILREYAERLEGTTVLFPCAAIRCARNLAQLSDNRLLLLSGDKGYSREELLAGRAEPGLAVHGSFSMMVNYHALGRWFVHRGSESLSTSHFYSSLTVVAGLLGTPPAGLLDTRLAFDDFVERLGPDDFFDLKKGRDDEYERLTLEQILSWLRFSGWDSNTFFGCFPALMKHAESSADVLRAEVYRMVHEVWKNHFPIREPRDLAFHLGVVLCEIQCYQEALPFFQESLAAYGPNPATVFNVALCQFQTGDLEAARVNVEESLKGAPDFEPAQALREELEAALPGDCDPDRVGRTG
ncbi:MAG TPA: SAM-dependent methyltransferase [Thermoanaerobaculia bacterium]|nr:SAM-dependent methyltransferase [Thermoanaerobaculia bacterium]